MGRSGFGPTFAFAPGRTMIALVWPSDRMMACPVGTSGIRSTWSLMPWANSRFSDARPASSSPTAPTITTSEPPRRAATAWFAPLPPA